MASNTAYFRWSCNSEYYSRGGEELATFRIFQWSNEGYYVQKFEDSNPRPTTENGEGYVDRTEVTFTEPFIDG